MFPINYSSEETKLSPPPPGQIPEYATDSVSHKLAVLKAVLVFGYRIDIFSDLSLDIKISTRKITHH